MAQKGADGKQNRDAISQKLIEMCRDGNLDAIRFVFDRVDGKVPEQAEIQQSGAQRIEIVYVNENPNDHQDIPAVSAPGSA